MTFPPQSPMHQPEEPALHRKAPQEPWPPLQSLLQGDPSTIGPYAVQGRLGAGTLGVVYGATDALGRWLAVKLISTDHLPDDEAVDAFLTEIAQMQRVRARHIAPLLDGATEGTHPWYATAYVPGLTLARWVGGQGALSAGMSRALAAGVAEALTGIHATGILHRNLTPANVILAPDGPTVLDFGITQAVDGDPISNVGALTGSPAWLSPERINGQAGPRSDIFTWGALVAYAATGQHPFGTGTPEDLMQRVLTEEPELSGLPPDLAQPVERALAKDPTDRPSAAELVYMVAKGGATAAAAAAAAEADSTSTTDIADAVIRSNWNPPITPGSDGAATPHMSAYPPTPPPPGDADTALDDEDSSGPGTRIAVLATVAAAVLALVLGVGTWLVLPGADEEEHVDDDVIQIALIPWDEAIAVTHLWATILDGAGHEVEIVEHDVEPAFEDVASGNVDLFLDAWFPDTHGAYADEYSDRWEDLGSWYDNAVLTLTVPDYVEEVDSIADLPGNAELFDNQIIGIEQDSGHMSTTREHVLPDYGLDSIDLFAGSSAAMTVELDYAIREEEPVVVTLWHPHTAYAEHDLKDLADPEGSLGDGEQLHALARDGFSADHPQLREWLEEFHLGEDELVTLFEEIFFEEHEDERDAVRAWLDGNPQFLERTLGDDASEVHLN
ncbi:glycine betaine ABC transporter substrate-binding protein [Lipingzhangella sp. LS1_29]|uniref:Glycine betaine ABC transporter substrate-binding protein n=1 Tax=Lipingzhangella rawalii TaxID=2055835 RepID=A0ABU2H9Q4_9ACTN|nr:glycine betaine ABC transporter substrate-binding protein [Lipingzhangella rawalii]MDS1271575.1 glycine betaine ABC transporter substrate-binding protein [Lipingzhangella rawalii]